MIPEFLPERSARPIPPPHGPSAINHVPGPTCGFYRRAAHERFGDLYAETLAFMERYLVTRVLSKYQGNQSKLASAGNNARQLTQQDSRLKVSIDRLVQIEGESC